MSYLKILASQQFLKNFFKGHKYKHEESMLKINARKTPKVKISNT